MSPTSFTFLNATGTSELSPLAAKQMRAHITRTNFAKRRQRIHQDAEAGAAETRPKGGTAGQHAPEPMRWSVLTGADLVAALPLVMQPADPYSYAQLLSRLWSLAFLNGRDYPTNPDEAGWICLLVSEPALVESSMAIGARHWSPDMSCQQLAEVHSSKAVNIVIQRIKSGRAHADGVLGAVLTMAFGERLTHNVLAWGIHITGVARLVGERRSRGVNYLPPWFYDILVLDSMNNVLGFPRFYHEKIIKAASAYGYHPLSDIATISDSLVQLCESIDAYRRHQLGPSFVAEEIEGPQSRLLCQTQALQNDDNPSIQATSRTIELFLHLSWRRQSEVNLTPIASELKEALCRLRLRPCSYMDLTSCQIMIGAIAAEKGSQTRAWFVATLRSASLALQSRGWDDPLEILEKGFVSDSSLMARFRSLWKELDQ